MTSRVGGWPPTPRFGSGTVPGIETGTIRDHPYVKVGAGPERLVVIPGLNDPLLRATDTRWFSLVVTAFCRRYRSDRTRSVLYVSRRRDLSADVTTREMAEGYATVLDDIGPAAVMGLSMGGFVVQHLAVDCPALVERAVMGLSAARLSRAGRRTIARWREHALADDWRSIYLGAADVVTSGTVRRALRLSARIYDVLTPRSPVTTDFVASADACLDHDASDRLDELAVPTLVVGGTADPFFDERGFRETATRVPDGRLRLLDSVGHEAVIQHRQTFDGAVLDFLDRA